jgi:proteic killer suppression protein
LKIIVNRVFKRRGFWSVTVRANWRIIFRFQGEDAFDVELIDYH